jgi:outer membrane protein assembly factor BamB
VQLLPRLVLLVLLGVLAGCETVGGWFEMDDEEDPQQPAELLDIEQQLDVRKLWSVGIGKGQGDGLYRLQPVIDGEVIYAVSADGELQSIDSRTRPHATGSRNSSWLFPAVSASTRIPCFLAAAMVKCCGWMRAAVRPLWTTALSGEVLAPPQGNGRVVVAQTYDGKLYGLDFASGEVLWRYDSNVPVLTIRGTSTPILSDGVVYAGFASGRVFAFDASTGAIRWEARVAIPQGRSEIERIVDVDGAMALAGAQLYVASYQGRVAALDIRTGQRIWQRNISSFYGVSQGFGNVYVAEESGTVTAFLRNGQGIRWQQEALAWRGLDRVRCR